MYYSIFQILSVEENFQLIRKMLFLLGYFRLGLLVFAGFYFDKPIVFLWLYIIQALLDG